MVECSSFVGGTALFINEFGTRTIVEFNGEETLVTLNADNERKGIRGILYLCNEDGSKRTLALINASEFTILTFNEGTYYRLVSVYDEEIYSRQFGFGETPPFEDLSLR